jgi:hypothetical protein
MSTVVEVKQKTKEPTELKTFNKLIKKIEELKKEAHKKEQLLDNCLSLHNNIVQPAKKEFCTALDVYIQALYSVYVHVNFPASVLKKITRMIETELDDLFSLCHFSETSSAVREIFKVFSETSCEDLCQQQSDQAKKELEAILKENGLDIDLTEISEKDNKEEVFIKFFDALRNSNCFKDTDVETEKEKKQKKLEELQKNGAKSIYIKLAKAYHPDFEQCPQKKEEKGAIMKNLTVAYEEKDLFTLLKMDAEWLSSSGEEITYSANNLKAYNALLKKKESELKEYLLNMHYNPRYSFLSEYDHVHFYELNFCIHNSADNYKKNASHLMENVEALQANNSKQTLKRIVKEYF